MTKSVECLERSMWEFETSLDRIVERYYVDQFAKEAEKTKEYWQNVEPVEPPASGEPRLEDRLAVYLEDWLVLSASQEARQRLEQ